MAAERGADGVVPSAGVARDEGLDALALAAVTNDVVVVHNHITGFIGRLTKITVRLIRSTIATLLVLRRVGGLLVLEAAVPFRLERT
jgi:hypothetical protein